MYPVNAYHARLQTLGDIGRQRGALTLLMASTLMVVLGLAALFMAKLGVSEQRLTYNYLQSRRMAGAANTSLLQSTAEIAYKQLESVITTPHPTDGYVLNVKGQTTFNVQDSTGATIATYTGRILLVPDLWRVTLDITTVLNDGAPTGLSLTRHTYQTLDFWPILNPMGNADPSTGAPLIYLPLIARGNITTAASNNIVNNNAVYNQHTLSGGTYKQGGTSINDTLHLAGIADLANATADEFFASFISLTPGGVQARALTINCTTGCKANTAAIQSLTNNIKTGAGMYGLVWIEGTLDLNGTVTLGDKDFPVILIATNNVTLSNNNAKVIGTIYTRGNFSMSKGAIYGSVITELDANITGGTLSYEDATVDLGTNGRQANVNVASIGYYSPLPGTWRDF